MRQLAELNSYQMYDVISVVAVAVGPGRGVCKNAQNLEILVSKVDMTCPPW